MGSKDSLIMLLGMLIVGPYALLIAGGLFVNANEKKIYGSAAKHGQGQTAHA